MWNFVLSSVGVSLSGVMSPGAMTAGVIAAGVRRPWAGLMMALGHAVVEAPLMVAILLFAGELLGSRTAQIVIGGAGGGMLLVLAGLELASLLKARQAGPPPAPRMGPFLGGVILSAGNPFFVAWWATTGLMLTTQLARDHGVMAFAMFGLIHWLCDLVWMLLLSWASHVGAGLAGQRWQRGIQAVCAAAMFYFGIRFLYATARMCWG